MSPRSRRWIALLALAILFALAAGQLLRRTVREHRQATLRFAHWQLEPGIRAAFDAIVRDYEALHPDVRIEQLSIPERIYPSWGLTQLVGGVAPDLIELGRGMGGPDVFRYFLPITEEVEQPNPYNAGTPLEHLPWRKTYADGMESAYNLDGFECYGASVFAATSRMYCNADLLREVTGGTELPRTFEDLLALGEKVRAHARRTGRPLVLIAGSRGYATVLFDDLLRGQIQRLVSEMNPGGRLPAELAELQLGYLDGRWSLQHPGMRGAAELMRLICGEMPPGFQQFGREDSAFHFAQGRALLLLAFSVDATGIRQQVNFPVQVFRIPAPEPGNSGFGANLLGPNSEGTLNVYGAFGLARSSRQPALALDFLRYLTSQAANRKFALISGSLPVILGVEPEGLTKDLMPDSRGYPPGPNFMFTGNTGRVVLSRIHLLTGPDASGAAFLDSVGRELASGIRADVDAELRKLRSNAILNDSIIEAVHRRALAAPGNLMLQRKFQSLVESQNEQEAKAAYCELRLRQVATRD